MRGTKFSKDSVEFKMFNDFWKILQDFYNPDSTDEFWEDFIKAQGEFVEKYNNLLGRMLSNLLVTYLEKKQKGEENG